jgi:spermidine synthase
VPQGVLSREPAAPVPPDESPTPSGQGAHFGLLLLCFFLSGVAALIYQTAWTRLFSFVFGTSELAVASVLAAYMGGRALGAAVVARLTPRIRRPVLVYGLLELGIGVSALAVPVLVHTATNLYVATFGAQGAPADEGGLLSALFYLACSFAILLVPTSLMGATLPLLARHAVQREDQIGRRIAQLYAINTAGAVSGTVVTAFALLPSLGLSNTVWVAVCANGAVFVVAAMVARRAPALESTEEAVSDLRTRHANHWILPLIGVSGAVSFTYEVLWTRLLGHVLGGSVYAFATMLATFLTGIAIGSWLASGRMAASRRRAAASFAWAQLGTGLLSFAAYAAIDWAPDWIARWGSAGDLALAVDVGVCAAILLPGTLFIGATVPLAVRVLARSQNDAGPATARVYAWNTVGAIVGAVGAGFFLIPAVGFAVCLAMAVTANAALALATALRTRPRPRVVLAAAVGVALLVAVVNPEPPWRLLRAGALSRQVQTGEIVYYGVGRSSTVLMQEVPDGWRLKSNGLAEAVINRPGVRPGGFVMVRWLSNLPAWGRPEARSILIVGFGGGLVVEAVPPNFEQVDVVEIEPQIIHANAAIAKDRRQDPLADPRVEIIVNDARGALLLTDERYDAIASQPSHPWTAAASHLYTREFFALVRDHLEDDGVFVQWMGLGFIDEALLKSLVATLVDVFPHVRVYRPVPGGLLFTASASPFEPEHKAAAVLRSTPRLSAELGIHAGDDIIARMVLDEEGARAYSAGAAVSTDDRNLLQMGSPVIVRSGRNFDPTASLAPFDPLAVSQLDWPRMQIVRRLLATGLGERAKRIALAGTDVEQNVGRGLIAHAYGNPGSAIASFRGGLAHDPNDHEARIGLLRMAHTTQGQQLAPPFDDASALEQLLIDGWNLEAQGQWHALQELDQRLGEIAARDPAYVAAALLRVAWRVEEGSEHRAREALDLLDAILPLENSLQALVLRARMAARTGYSAGAISSLHELLRRTQTRRADAAIIRDALAVLAELPSSAMPAEQLRNLAAHLRARAAQR